MKICGVIAEYNPFHNGHAYQLARARDMSGCDYIIVCMGGSFSQRGDVMLLDKWTRARMALENGADLVIELPALFAVRNAEGFATGGVLILGGLCADSLSFGCETDDLSLLFRLAEAMHSESDALSSDVRAQLAAGKSHARARGEAVARHMDVAPALLAAPNVTLAIEYLRATRRLAFKPDIYVVARQGGYHDQSIGAFSSASAIRNAVANGAIPDSIKETLPASCFSQLKQCLSEGHFAYNERLDAALLYLLRTQSADSLAALTDVGEGMEMLFMRHAAHAGDRESLLRSAKCKRYTHARLNRFCAHALLNLTAESVRAHVEPTYARVIGFRKDAAPLLRHLKEHATLPLITDPVLLKGDPVFHYDCLATDLQALAMENALYRAVGQDFTHRMLIV